MLKWLDFLQVGYDKQGLPIGLQLIGRPWGEATILRMAAAVEVSICTFTLKNKNNSILKCITYLAHFHFQELFSDPKKKPVTYYDILKGR